MLGLAATVPFSTLVTKSVAVEPLSTAVMSQGPLIGPPLMVSITVPLLSMTSKQPARIVAEVPSFVGRLPTITHPVLIDGYSQPGASPNTQINSDNAVIRRVTPAGTSSTYAGQSQNVNSGLDGVPSTTAYLRVPGAIAHTRTPTGARSRAIGSVMPRIAAFAAA